MNKIISILITGIIISAFFSCTPEQIADEIDQPQACCTETIPILTPPPPPPPEDDDN